MVFARLRARNFTRNFISALIIFTLTCSLGLAEPVSKKSKSRKTAARSAKKVTKKVARTRSAAAKSRAGKSKRVNARDSRRKGRASKSRTLNARNRNSRSRWRGRVATSRPSYHPTGIHNFLTQSWVSAKNAPQPQAEPAQTVVIPEQTESGYVQRKASSPAYGSSGAPVDAVQFQSKTTAETLQDPLSLNPLVLAYANSLSARGFDAGNQGFIVETLDGEILAEHNADRPFNPASVVKVATSLVAISKLGPDFRFRTSLYTDGALDPATGTLHGSIYLIGSGDPAFFYENAMLIADQLNRSGIREVTGNLYVLGQFYFNLSASREASAKSFRNTLTPDSWSNGTRAAFQRFQAMRAPASSTEQVSNGLARVSSIPSAPPSLKITGETITEQVVDTTNLKLLAVHTSLPLVRVLKGLNDFSNNWMASVIGNLVGGPYAVHAFLRTEVGLKQEELNIVTSSGLGTNYISPRGTIQILRKLNNYLRKGGLTIEEILPVAGVDAGTLQRRFTDSYRGSVVGKTGTLRSVSALAGVAYTRTKGPLLFVIYNHGGSPATFRNVQDETIKKLITFFGGPAPVRYVPNSAPRVSERTVEADSTSPALIAPR